MRRGSGGYVHTSFADRKPRQNPICPVCNERPKTVEIVLQARGTSRPNPGSLSTRARRLCETCALAFYERMEAILDGYTE